MPVSKIHFLLPNFALKKSNLLKFNFRVSLVTPVRLHHAKLTTHVKTVVPVPMIMIMVVFLAFVSVFTVESFARWSTRVMESLATMSEHVIRVSVRVKL